MSYPNFFPIFSFLIGFISMFFFDSEYFFLTSGIPFAVCALSLIVNCINKFSPHQKRGSFTWACKQMQDGKIVSRGNDPHGFYFRAGSPVKAKASHPNHLCIEWAFDDDPLEESWQAADIFFDDVFSNTWYVCDHLNNKDHSIKFDETSPQCRSCQNNGDCDHLFLSEECEEDYLRKY